MIFGLKNLGAALGLALAAWLVVGTVLILVRRLQGSNRKWAMLRSTPAATFGMMFAHIGLGLFVAGVTSVSAWQEESVVALPIGGSIILAGYEFTLADVKEGAQSNYQFERGVFDVARGGQNLFSMMSERRFYPVSNRVTTEAAIKPRGVTNLYVAMGERQMDGKWVARFYYHPLVLLIWFGPALMALGGAVSLADRRMRIGAPSPKLHPATA
jgi:cytochrome c-type biogenesis protein CcmF